MPRLAREFTHVDSYHSRNFGAVHKAFLEDRTSQWSSGRRRVAKVIESWQSDVLTGCMISFNTMIVVWETDVLAKGDHLAAWMYAISLMFIAIYTTDLIVRLFVYRSYFFWNRWNIFDFTVVAIDLVAELITLLFADTFPLPTSVLKIFRLGRLLRFVCVLTMFEELNKMLHLMLASLPTLMWGIFLITCTITGWSIVAVQLLNPLMLELTKEGHFDDCSRCPRAFSSVFQSNLTFFQQLVFGDSWGAVSVVLLESAPWTALILIGAGISVQVGILNLILTVIVEKATDQRESDSLAKLRAKADQFVEARDGLTRICHKLDKDGDGMINIEELENGFDNDLEFASMISLMDLNLSDLPGIFALLDSDRSGSVSRQEFVEELYRIQTVDLRAMMIHAQGKAADERIELRQCLDEVLAYVEQTAATISETLANADHTHRFNPQTQDGASDSKDGANGWSVASIENNFNDLHQIQEPFKSALRQEIPQLLLKVGQIIESQMASAISKAMKENGVSQQLPVVHREAGNCGVVDQVKENGVSQQLPAVLKGVGTRGVGDQVKVLDERTDDILTQSHVNVRVLL